MQRRPTVTDVATHAGVGASTVSRFLRGVALRADAARRVAKAIDELGYTPHEAARVLRGGSSKTIGIIAPQVANTFFSRVIETIERMAAHSGFAIILLLHGEDRQRQEMQLQTLRRYRVDGVVLAAVSGTTYADIKDALGDIPVVAFDRPLSPEIDSVSLRNFEAAHMATRHLLQHGYRKIMCVTANEQLGSFQERIAGFESAVEPASASHAVWVAKDYNELRMLLANKLRESRQFPALLSLSNMATMSILLACKDLDLNEDRMPRFIGFDDFELAPLMRPAITTVRQPTDLMVRYSFDMLMRKIESKAAKAVNVSEPLAIQAISLPAELVCRSSCGCEP